MHCEVGQMLRTRQ